MNKLLVEAELQNIGLIEAFVYASSDIPNNKRAGALIITTEIFENIVEHAILEEGAKIRLAASKIFFPRLCFTYRSKNFDNLLRALKNTKPHFDPKTKRYRGFGLSMTKNIARKVYYRQCSDYSVISIYL